MKRVLNMRDRFVLLSILPQNGELLTARTVLGLQNMLGITDEEGQAIDKATSEEMRKQGTLNLASVPAKEFEFGEFAVETIVNALKKKNEKKELEPNMVILWDMFVEEPTPKKE